jgi:hypothetical protein
MGELERIDGDAEMGGDRGERRQPGIQPLFQWLGGKRLEPGHGRPGSSDGAALRRLDAARFTPWPSFTLQIPFAARNRLQYIRNATEPGHPELSGEAGPGSPRKM